MTTNNTKIFALTCKAGYAEGLDMGKEYKAKLTLVQKNAQEATFEVKVNPDQKTERATPREEMARTALWRCSDKDGNRIIQAKTLEAVTDEGAVIAQRDLLHEQLDALYITIMANVRARKEIGVA